MEKQKRRFMPAFVAAGLAFASLLGCHTAANASDGGEHTWHKYDININREDLSLEAGEHDKLEVSVDENGNCPDYHIEWKSADEDVAVVDENGIVTAVGRGKALICAYIIEDAYLDDPDYEPECACINATVSGK